MRRPALHPLARSSRRRACRAGARRARRRRPRSPPPRATTTATRAARPRRRAARARRSVVGDQARELGGQGVGLAGGEQQAAVAVGQQLLVDGERRGERARRPRRSRAGRRPGAGAVPTDAATTTSAPREASPGLLEAHAVAQALGQRAPWRSARAALRTVASQRRAGSSRRSARRKIRSAPRSSSSTNTIRTRPPAARGARRRRRRAGRRGSRRGTCGAMRSAVVWKLAIRASRRPKSSSTIRRAACIETSRSAGAWNVPTFSAREWRRAAAAVESANGSWTWTTSSGAFAHQLLDGARDVDRQAGRAAARRRRQLGQDLADGEHPRAVRVEQRVAALADERARVAHEALVARRGDDQDAVPTLVQLAGDAVDEDVDLVGRFPRVRRDVRDGEGHCAVSLFRRVAR